MFLPIERDTRVTVKNHGISFGEGVGSEMFSPLVPLLAHFATPEKITHFVLSRLQKRHLQHEKECLMAKLVEAELDGAAAAKQIQCLKETIGKLKSVYKDVGGDGDCSRVGLLVLPRG